MADVVAVVGGADSAAHGRLSAALTREQDRLDPMTDAAMQYTSQQVSYSGCSRSTCSGPAPAAQPPNPAVPSYPEWSEAGTTGRPEGREIEAARAQRSHLSPSLCSLREWSCCAGPATPTRLPAGDPPCYGMTDRIAGVIYSARLASAAQSPNSSVAAKWVGSAAGRSPLGECFLSSRPDQTSRLGVEETDKQSEQFLAKPPSQPNPVVCHSKST